MNAPPPEGRISAALTGTDDTLVAKPRWTELAGVRAIVGSCRGCGGDMQAIEPGPHDASGEDGEVTWYEARCRSCGKEIAAPNGRVMRRSGAHRETPPGWLEQRAGRDEEERKQRAGYDADGNPPGHQKGNRR